MSRIVSAFVGLLGCALLFPLQAQDSESQLFNFNVGGGLSVPLNPTGRYIGVDGNAGSGAGVNFNKHNSLEGDFMWSGLSPTVNLVPAIDRPTGSINLFAVTGNYRFHIDNLAHSVFGVYIIGGGGWYYRHTDINKNYVVPPLTVCQPIYNWWGFACDSNGFVQTATIASHGTSAGGLDVGAGFTVKLPSPGWKFFMESRYNYAWSNFIPTTLVPVMFGFRYN
jgi:Outer membrane protein beta-barrel domain